MSAILRTATGADARAIAALHIASWRATYRSELPAEFLASLDLDERTAIWHTRLADTGMRVTVADDDGRVVGFCSFGPIAPDAWEIFTLHIDPQHHGAGVGSRLFDTAVESAREQGAKHVVLWVVETNDHARRFYEHKGMAPNGERQLHQLGVGGSVVEVRYHMPVQP